MNSSEIQKKSEANSCVANLFLAMLRTTIIAPIIPILLYLMWDTQNISLIQSERAYYLRYFINNEGVNKDCLTKLESRYWALRVTLHEAERWREYQSHSTQSLHLDKDSLVHYLLYGRLLGGVAWKLFPDHDMHIILKRKWQRLCKNSSTGTLIWKIAGR